MASRKKQAPALTPLFSTVKPAPQETAPTAMPPEPKVYKDPDYDKLVPLKIKEASDTKIRCLITWADYCYWVKNEPIMHDYTFDMLVREYEARRPDDRAFLDRLGMWG